MRGDFVDIEHVVLCLYRLEGMRKRQKVRLGYDTRCLTSHDALSTLKA